MSAGSAPSAGLWWCPGSLRCSPSLPSSSCGIPPLCVSRLPLVLRDTSHIDLGPPSSIQSDLFLTNYVCNARGEDIDRILGDTVQPGTIGEDALRAELGPRAPGGWCPRALRPSLLRLAARGPGSPSWSRTALLLCCLSLPVPFPALAPVWLTIRGPHCRCGINIGLCVSPGKKSSLHTIRFMWAKGFLGSGTRCSCHLLPSGLGRTLCVCG